MTRFLKELLVGVGLALVIRISVTLQVPQTFDDQVPDAFQVYGRFPYIVAISDSNNDTIFECLSAKRTEYDPEAKKVTYVVIFKGHHGGQKKNVAFHVSEGPSPSTIEFTEDEQCFLYVPKEMEDNVPRHCIDHFAAICGVAVPVYRKDLCPDDEEDNF
ncbi:uncharacterized protein LOC142588997 isoform X2 [Dermacentor variabilis]|uniref:uncharacterized protein LOC142588997 isoform X2 n=1 Tax=Dermacentor variabilis TaxID=34621 RepID=UPI003F5C790B